MKAFNFNLKLVPISTTIKVGFYVLLENHICQITSINKINNTVVVDNMKELPIEEVENKVVKFMAEYKDQTYNIINSYFTSIVGFLYEEVIYKEDVAEEDRKYGFILEALLSGEQIFLKGTFEEIKTRTLPNEAVKITDLSIIDRFKLYEKEERVGIVQSFDNKTHLFTIQLNNSQTVVGRRNSFVKIGDKDIISMIKLWCPNCRQ